MSDRAWKDLLAALPAHQRKLERRVLGELGAEFGAWAAARRAIPAPRAASDEFALAEFLVERIDRDIRQVEETGLRHGQFVRRLGQATSDEERRRLLLEHSRALGADKEGLKGDEEALARWFGADALGDRVQARLAWLERRITQALFLLGRQARAVLEAATEEDSIRLWQKLGVESAARSLFAFEGHPRVRLAAFYSVAEALKALPPARREKAVEASTVQFIYRCALEPRQYLWLQVEALELLGAVAPASFLEIARLRLTRRHGGDDLFLRRRALLQAANALAELPDASDLLPLALDDDSAYVRQGLARALAPAPAGIVRQCLPPLLADPVPQVRAQALLAVRDALASRVELPLLDWFAERLETETDAFVLRTAFFVTEAILAASHGDDTWIERLRLAILALHESAPDLKVRRWAAETLGHFSLQADPSLRALVRDLSDAVSRCAPRKRRRLPSRFDEVPAERLAQAAVFLVRADYHLDFERRFGHWHVHRGHRFGFRLWRWLYEFRYPSPDKRQAFRHTIGRIFRGHVRVPSPILAELAATKVPGEPLQMSTEAGWRPYLPLPDDLISCLDLPANRFPLRIFTAEGVTEVMPPVSLVHRLLVRARLVWRFADFAQARNWQENSQQPADHYVRLLNDTGFSLRFVPRPGTTPDPAVTRFFPASLALPVGSEELWNRFQNYFFSVYGNTLFELAVLVAAAMAAFTARHQLANLKMRRARRDIPLVVGGWGTRGKSGTERLKAALFNALGYGVVSKTTGCEAMFLHSYPYQPLREMFLFRPYDKATIWEQLNVTRISSELKADVLLWECMALTPSFVELLQKRWMRDDLSTITNTFPDHEDLQGPAGIDIPQVMTHFIPRRSMLLTSEEQMRPILRTAAERLGTRMDGVGWLQSGLLAPDVLARFPYQEHPDNIALVIRMAAEFGIDEDFAVKAMADEVVPDLGVLKVYPEAPVAGRRLSFANGMSANERFGCLGNWTRLGFDRIDMDAEPGTIVSTVVNNRADRIARSRVFASILVSDIDADFHFLIGSNLEGLRGYIREAWHEHVAALSLWPDSGEAPAAVLEAQARRLRVPYTEGRQRARLAAMLAAAGLEEDETLAQHFTDPAALAAALAQRGLPRAAEIAAVAQADAAARTEYEQFAARLAGLGASPDSSLDNAFRELLWRWFERKIVVVADYYASGNQIIQLVAEKTPPGFLNRVMGIQNIKGTGLDFIYRWQAWALCHTACTDLRASDGASYRRGLAALSAFQEYGVLTEDYVRETLALARHSPHGQLAIVQSQLAQIEANLDQVMASIRGELGATREQGRLEEWILLLEGFVDAGDAIRRRRLANQIYRDLVAQRISHSRAAIELLKLTQRQKGGWLYDRLRSRARMLAEAPGEIRAALGRMRLLAPARRKRPARGVAAP